MTAPDHSASAASNSLARGGRPHMIFAPGVIRESVWLTVPTLRVAIEGGCWLAVSSPGGVRVVPIIVVIEGLIKALDLAKKSVEFFGQFERRRRQIFLNHIHPAFESLQPVLHAYGDDISSFRADISGSLDYASADRAIVNFEEKRRQTVRERSEVVAALHSTGLYWVEHSGAKRNLKALEAYHTFMLRLSEYFRNYEQLPSFFGTVDTHLLKYAVEHIRNRKSPSKVEQRRQWPSAKAELLDQCTAAMDILERRHARVFGAYTDLKLACIGEGSLVQKS